MKLTHVLLPNLFLHLNNVVVTVGPALYLWAFVRAKTPTQSI